MKHIYYKNDFAVEITLLNASGEVVAPPEWQWHIEFTDGRRKYICSVDKGNAKVVGNTIMCYLDNHKFCCGEIGYKFVQAIPDLNYLDGFQKLITPKALPIELWEQESDNDVNIQSSVVPAYVVYDAYMTAKANGYTGTSEEFYDALIHIVDINTAEAERVEAESNRVTAEQQRVENFVEMESALTTATTKANTATTKAEEATKMAGNSATAASQAATQATTATKRANDISADLEAKREADYWRGAKGDKGDKGDTGAKGDRGEKGDQGERGLQGVQGVKGDDGVSTTVKTSKTGKVTTIEITDAKGTHTATVNDGESVEVVQSTGTSTTAVMSQKAVSDKLSEVDGKVDELESKVGNITINENFEEQTKDLFFLGTLENPIPINSTVVITIDTLEGSGIRLVLIKEDGTRIYRKLTLGTNSFNTSHLTYKGLALYHKANTGSLNVKGNIEFSDGLISAINKIKDVIPDSATSVNKLVTQEDIEDVVSKSDIVDNLQETRSDLVLSANQGKILNDKVEISLTEEYSIFNDYELVQGYWNTGGGVSTGGNPVDGESAGYRHRTNKIPVIAGEEYLISGVVSSPVTCLVYLFGDPPFNEKIGVGTGTPIKYTDYKLTIPQGCTHIGVQSNDPTSNLVIKKKQVVFKAYTKEEVDEKFMAVGNTGLLYKTTETIHLGDNVAVGDFTLAEGWDGDAVSGYTHSSGMNAISLNVQTTNGEVYLFEADVEIADSTIEFCKANFGNNPQCLTYNGTNHISVPLLSDGGQFILTPVTTNTFKLSNITLQKISDEGIEKILNLYNIISVNHNKNYGFWNVLLGSSSMQDAVGSTRTIAIGNFALNALKSGNRNIAVGTYSMNEMVNGENNIAIGADSMEYVKSAQNCVAIGKGIMGLGKNLYNNVAIGYGCINGSSDSESSYNIGIGFDAGYNITGQSNTCIGYKAGEFIGKGSANVAIGRSVSIGSGTNRNTCVGDRASAGAGVNDSIALGTTAKAEKSNQMVLGGANITEVVMCGNKKIIFNADGSVTWESIL